MTTVLVLTISLPVTSAAAAAALAARRSPPTWMTDMRGVALQTVIIMVVLLAIAGGVATALLATGGRAVDQMERQTVTTPASAYKTEVLCGAAGHNWYGGSCHDTPRGPATSYATKAACQAVGYRWDESDPDATKHKCV